MKKVLSTIVVLLLLAHPAFGGRFKVLHVVDGDTIDIMYHGKKERIRMLCVDTPESVHQDHSKNTFLGIKASNYTRSRLENQFVDIEFESKTRGNHNRLLAYVFLDGYNFNIELVKMGWSRYDTRFGFSEKHHDQFAAAEKYAKENRLNIWASRQDIIPTPAQMEYHGNVKSHKFHRPGCRQYNCKKCTRIFWTIQGALNAGYSPCGICRP